jgi:hypothetical protein
VSLVDSPTSRRAELTGPRLTRERIEHGVDHAGFAAVDEGVGDIDIFGYDHASRNIVAHSEFIGVTVALEVQGTRSVAKLAARLAELDGVVSVNAADVNIPAD